LYKECLLLAINPWQTPRYLKLENLALKNKMKDAHDKVGARMAAVHISTLKKLYDHRDRLFAFNEIIAKSHSPTNVFRTAHYFRELSDCTNNENVHVFRDDDLIKLLSGELIFSTGVESGRDPWYDSFFCVDVETTDLPWDTEVVDW
jgi:hypothetical protein